MIYMDSRLRKLFYCEDAIEEDIEEALDHGVVVSNLAYNLGRNLNLSEEECRELAEAGMIHDVGKLKLGRYLYGRRSDVLHIEEMKYVRMHPALGYGMLNEEGGFPEKLMKMILHHHENYDGSGYPDNIAGENIPLGSRILRICDVFSALVTERPYRSAFEIDTAMELMIDEVKNFDMKAFLEFMRLVHSEEFGEIAAYVNEINGKTHVKIPELKLGRAI